LGGEYPINEDTDQAGNPVSKDRMYRMVCESILANVIAFEEAGVPQQELTQAVGRDGGIVIGRGVVLQTPIERHLPEEGSKLLFRTYAKLISDYNAGRLDAERIDRIQHQNNVRAKTGMIRSNLRKRG
jgi:hypothetical protein